MKLLFKILLGIVAVCILIVAGLYASGRGNIITILAATVFAAPDMPFDPADAVAPPDYADPASWAALPEREDLADMRPKGIGDPDIQGSAPVDVFFIHPTGFLKGSSWTFSMDANTATEENTQWMMSNQASPYNGCCNIYAPRYRQATIFSYFTSDKAFTEEVLSFAYQDVARAFEYFIENYSFGRPFIIASHSQGTHHAIRLLHDKVDGTPLAERLVAAYILGGGIKTSQFADMQDITLCEDAQSTQCAVHWDTYSVAVIDDALDGREGNVCVNPLSWKVNGGAAGKEMHKGAVAMSGVFDVGFSGDDAALGTKFDALSAPLINYVSAECKNGVLYISDQTDTLFGERPGFGGGNYHLLDYPIFHMDIRENAKLKVLAHLKKAGITEPPPTGDFLDALRETD